jgi:hypothetical protein
MAGRLKDIPDRWKAYDPENPPYRFFPNRTRGQTGRLALFSTVAMLGLGYYITEVQDRAGKKKVEDWSKQMPFVITQGDKRKADWQNEAFQEIFLDARRQRLGLPRRVLGSAEMPADQTFEAMETTSTVGIPLPPHLRH